MFSPALEAELEAELHRGGAEYTVILDDTRQRITATTAEPFRHVCQITASLPDANRGGAWTTWIGSGTLVAPNKVLTAGHVIYDRGYQVFARNVRVAPGKVDAGTGPRQEPYGSAVASRLDVTPTYRSTTASQDVVEANDYAVITLAQRISDRRPRDRTLGTSPLGWWRQLRAASDALLRGRQINNAGYPVDRTNGDRMYHAYNRVASTTAHRLSYVNDTFGGQSGGPVWLRWQNSRILVGVHTAGFLPGQPQQNSGVRLNATNLAVIRTWLRA
ncbi:MAG TPA: trypsin-like serine protease [Micromonosporaceae bacterium]|nr:trypsin-like serine protease [Micromonosporaceae bacterium]